MKPVRRQGPVKKDVGHYVRKGAKYGAIGGGALSAALAPIAYGMETGLLGGSKKAAAARALASIPLGAAGWGLTGAGIGGLVGLHKTRKRS